MVNVCANFFFFESNFSMLLIFKTRRGELKVIIIIACEREIILVGGGVRSWFLQPRYILLFRIILYCNSM